MSEIEQLRQELEAARATAAYWEREAVLRAAAIAATLFDQVALARALARNVESHLDGAISARRVRRSVEVFWCAAGRLADASSAPRSDSFPRRQ